MPAGKLLIIDWTHSDLSRSLRDPVHDIAMYHAQILMVVCNHALTAHLNVPLIEACDLTYIHICLFTGPKSPDHLKRLSAKQRIFISVIPVNILSGELILNVVFSIRWATPRRCS